MQLPLWFSLWQSLDSLLAIALNAAEAFPFLLFLCLFLFRSRRAPFLADSGRIFLKLGLICAVIGAADLLLRGLVDLEFLPAALDKLEPLPFEPFSSPWLGTTTTLAAWIAGIVLLYLTGNGARTLFLTSGMGTDEDTARRLSKKAGLLSAGAFIAFVCFFASIITRNWPFLGLPEQMTQQRVAEVLFAHAWRMTCGSLMPAGALAILAFFFSITNGAFRNASGDEKKTALLEDEDARTLRMICAAAIALTRDSWPSAILPGLASASNHHLCVSDPSSRPDCHWPAGSSSSPVPAGTLSSWLFCLFFSSSSRQPCASEDRTGRFHAHIAYCPL